MFVIDEGLIRVKSEAALALETRLEKQLATEANTKLKRILGSLISIYEHKKDIRPRVAQRQAINRWANNAQVKINFSRISKYLYEIDISNDEKKELEMKIQ
jgi:hypothetical protein